MRPATTCGRSVGHQLDKFILSSIPILPQAIMSYHAPHVGFWTSTRSPIVGYYSTTSCCRCLTAQYVGGMTMWQSLHPWTPRHPSPPGYPGAILPHRWTWLGQSYWPDHWQTQGAAVCSLLWPKITTNAATAARHVRVRATRARGPIHCTVYIDIRAHYR